MDELFKGRHFDRQIIVLCARWYLRYKLSFRDLVEMMVERGLSPWRTRQSCVGSNAMCQNSKSAGIVAPARWRGLGASTKPTSKSKGDRPISTVRPTKRERPSISCYGPSGTSRPPKPSSDGLLGARGGCRIRSRSTGIRLHVARPRRPSANILREIKARSDLKIFEQFDRTGSPIDQASARSDARPQAFPSSRSDRRHRTHAPDQEGSVQTRKTSHQRQNRARSLERSSRRVTSGDLQASDRLDLQHLHHNRIRRASTGRN
jgi:hypothetical protein